VHTTGGYLTGTYLTSKWILDLKDEDTYWCTADIGWVTGHSYVFYICGCASAKDGKKAVNKAYKKYLSGFPIFQKGVKCANNTKLYFEVSYLFDK